MAFVLGHEMAHHFEGINTTNIIPLAAAPRGLVDLDRLSVPWIIWSAMQSILARLGRYKFSKTYELEADQLGTWITTIAGYDALRGAAFLCACRIRVTSS